MRSIWRILYADKDVAFRNALLTHGVLFLLFLFFGMLFSKGLSMDSDSQTRGFCYIVLSAWLVVETVNKFTRMIAKRDVIRARRLRVICLSELIVILLLVFCIVFDADISFSFHLGGFKGCLHTVFFSWLSMRYILDVDWYFLFLKKN